jgi:hypothetical protein
MKENIIHILEKAQEDPRLGVVAQKAIEFIQDGKESQIFSTPGTGQLSFSIADTYKLRMKHKTYRPENFCGLSESISSLMMENIVVQLTAVQNDRGFVSIWLTDENHLLAVVIGSLPEKVDVALHH